MSRHFSKKDRCSTSLVIRELQIKSAVRITMPVGMLVSKSTNNTRWQVCEEKVTLMHCWDRKSVRPLWKTVWKFSKKLKIEWPHCTAIPLLHIYLKKSKTLIQKDICTPMFIAALFTIAKIRSNLVSIKSEWIKIWFIHIINTMEYYSAIKIMQSCHLW